MHDIKLTVREYVRKEIPDKHYANAILRALYGCGVDSDAPAASIMKISRARLLARHNIGEARANMFSRIQLRYNAFEKGYGFGYDDGYDAGYERAMKEIKESEKDGKL